MSHCGLALKQPISTTFSTIPIFFCDPIYFLAHQVKIWHIRCYMDNIKRQNCRIFHPSLRVKWNLFLHKHLFCFVISNSVVKTILAELSFNPPNHGGTRIARHGAVIICCLDTWIDRPANRFVSPKPRWERFWRWPSLSWSTSGWMDITPRRACAVRRALLKISLAMLQTRLYGLLMARPPNRLQEIHPTVYSSPWLPTPIQLD